MTIVYRTNGAWGAGQGYNLTAAQIDGNFYDLDQRIQAIEDNPPVPLNISNMTVVGTQWTIYLEDATAFGPFTLPQANFRPSVVAAIDGDTSGVYSPVLADANGYKRYAGSSDLTVLVPLNADVAYPVDTELTFRQAGDGAIIFDTATAGPTLNGIVGFLNRTGVGGATVTLKKVATDEWDLIGLLAEDVTA
ncbi:MAG: hypothetical protein EOS65_02710 [Mesorhizobium sp.]|uniref:hypothetical protein n=1 Tax=Mesorhizobium sp. TaxID=1871066 RepID=UPI000FE927E9|nr:hypothetical protein [Mesorhizobium sp.]RWF44306.1 MAG: hypothetical protein EOS65_02710 [Mesorhizobium sp.]